MSSHVVKKHGKFLGVIISCDESDCNATISSAALARGGGLKDMGWTLNLSGPLQHFCPEHKHENLP